MSVTINLHWVVYHDGVHPVDVSPFARGEYQRNILLGWQRYSGADLRGRASSFGPRYRQSRVNLRERLVRHGYRVWLTSADHNRVVLNIGRQSAVECAS